ncbi:MAG: outer membrane beta-barrel protein [Terracidiphilus sp.]
MCSNSILWRTLATLLLFSPFFASAQVVPSATDRTLPLAVGGGLSGFDPDLLRTSFGNLEQTRNSGIMLGVSGWADYFPQWMPQRLHGLGIEAEGHDIGWRQSSTETNFRIMVAGGGAIYSWRHFHTFRPYGKAGELYGQMRFAPDKQPYHSDTRNFLYFGGGFEYHVWRKVWMRADYEYQMWPDMIFGHGNYLSPEGVTVGATYRFGRPRLH